MEKQNFRQQKGTSTSRDVRFLSFEDIWLFSFCFHNNFAWFHLTFLYGWHFILSLCYFFFISFTLCYTVFSSVAREYLSIIDIYTISISNIVPKQITSFNSEKPQRVPWFWTICREKNGNEVVQFLRILNQQNGHGQSKFETSKQTETHICHSNILT